MSFTPLKFSRDWTNPLDFPTIASDEAQARANIQLLYDEILNYINTNELASGTDVAEIRQAAEDAQTAADAARDSADAVRQAAEDAQTAADAAQGTADAAHMGLVQHKADPSAHLKLFAAADAEIADARDEAKGLAVAATCYDEAAPGTSAPNTWYVPKTLPKPSGTTGMMVDVMWVHGRTGGLGYDIQLIWGEPGGADNEVIVPTASASDSLTGGYSIPTEGTVRYQLVETNGRLRWQYISGTLIPKQYSTDAPAAEADKPVHGMELEYLPGMEVYVQLDRGNEAETMRLVPDQGPTLPVYGNGIGAKTGDVPAGYILHLVNAGDHWQVVNGGGAGGAPVDVAAKQDWATTVVAGRLTDITDADSLRQHFLALRQSPARRYQFPILAGGVHENIITALGGRPEGVSERDEAVLYIDIPYSEEAGFEIHARYQLTKKRGIWEQVDHGSPGQPWSRTGWYEPAAINAPKHSTMMVLAHAHGRGYKADHTASEIKAHHDAGGLVLLSFDAPDGSGEQSYRYETYKDGKAIFRRPVVDVKGLVVKRIVIMVDELENVEKSEEKMDIPVLPVVTEQDKGRVLGITSLGALGWTDKLKAYTSASAAEAETKLCGPIPPYFYTPFPGDAFAVRLDQGNTAAQTYLAFGGTVLEVTGADQHAGPGWCGLYICTGPTSATLLGEYPLPLITAQDIGKVLGAGADLRPAWVPQGGGGGTKPFQMVVNQTVNVPSWTQNIVIDGVDCPEYHEIIIVQDNFKPDFPPEHPKMGDFEFNSAFGLKDRNSINGQHDHKWDFERSWGIYAVKFDNFIVTGGINGLAISSTSGIEYIDILSKEIKFGGAQFVQNNKKVTIYSGQGYQGSFDLKVWVR